MNRVSKVFSRSSTCNRLNKSSTTLADHLPDQASFDDAMYALYVRQKLERSLKAAEEGKITSQEEMEKRYLNHEG